MAWKWQEHINTGEARANRMAVTADSTSRMGGRPRQSLFVIDSSAAGGALKKGRSGSKTLNPVLKRTAAEALFDRLHMEMLQVPSAIMPADGASRGTS